MILVYTNSKERAMRLAACQHGGVIIPELQQFVRAKNYDSLHDKLEAMLLEDDCLLSLSGDHTFFVYSDGPIMTPKKMAEYKPDYARIENRPAPFIPDEFEYNIEPEFKKRLKHYREMVSEASSIINAASDDIAGELCFHQFLLATRCGYAKTFLRVRPKTLTEDDVITAFNEKQDLALFGGNPATASVLREQLDWLVSCNATTVLCQNNHERKLLIAGRMESMILTLLAEREESMANSARAKTYSVELTLQNEGTYTVDSMTSQAKAEQMATALTVEGKVLIASSEEHYKEAPFPLLNMFSLQEDMRAKHNFPIEKTSEAAVWLYEHGYISWPTNVSTMHWNLKTRFANAICELDKHPEYHGKIIPLDIDTFFHWSAVNSTFDHSGILISDRMDIENIPAEYMDVYRMIVDSNIRVIKQRNAIRTNTLTFNLGDVTYKAVKKSEASIPLSACQPGAQTDKGITQKDIISSNQPIEITSVRVINSAPATPYKDSDIARDLLAIAPDAHWNQHNTFSAPIENLIAWKQVERAEDGTLTVTPRGHLAYKYLRNTSLTILTEATMPDRRLGHLLTHGGAEDIMVEDIYTYVEVVCAELAERAREIAQMGGYAKESMKCPTCGAPVDFPENGGCRCIADDCRFYIPKSFGGHELTKHETFALLTVGYTPLIEFLSKAGKEYSARLALENGKVGLFFKSPFKCPKCQAQLQEYKWGLRCTEQSCNFSINTTVCNCRLADKDIRDLVEMRLTRNLQLTNKKGKSFVAKLKLGEDYTIQFDFPPRKDAAAETGEENADKENTQTT